MSTDVEPADIAAAAQLACLLEASAAKPGNVSPSAGFADTRYEHFLASAAAIGTPLGSAGTRPLGETIRLAIAATRRWTDANTNLGMVLLLSPLARAAAAGGRRDMTGPRAVGRAALRAAVGDVLAGTTVDDARQVYAAIRLASPGGLGTADRQDVSGEPTVTLVEAMRLAAHRDDVAREYATDFDATFDIAAPALDSARQAGLGWNQAVVETFLTLLVLRPDTHIARRAGPELAADVTRQAGIALDRGGARSAEGRAAIARLDSALRDHTNRANPGTTADITAAAIFVVLLGGGWHSRKGGSDAAPG